MSDPSLEAPRRGSVPWLPALVLLFVGSGCAALIYEIVWFQTLEFVIGASGVSLGVLLGTFMAGMFLGSLALPRLVPEGVHPLRVYALLELGIGALGLLLVVAIPAVGGAYADLVPRGFGGLIARSALCAVVLLPPTVLMGATLPAVARHVEATPIGVSWMGFFYGGNIAGAVLGSVLAGYYLLRVHDTLVATFVAVAINVAVAVLAFAIAWRSPHRAVARDATARVPLGSRRRIVYWAIGVSGLTALGAEVVWTRLLSLLLGATTYTFSLILAVFLAALGVGSAVGSYVARAHPDPRRMLAWCQLLAVLAVAWSAHAITSQLPYWPVNPTLTADPAILLQVDLARALWAILPAPLLWGASFPLAVAAAADRGQDPGRLVGGVYAANTLGAILGSLAFGLVLIPTLGTRTSQRILIAAPAMASVVLFATGSARHQVVRGIVHRVSAARHYAPMAAVAAMAALLIWKVAPVPPVLVAYGRSAPTYTPPITLYVGEGISSSIAVTELANGYRNFHVGGKIEASTEPQDMRLQRMLGHMTALLHQADPKSVLIVGFGAGVTAGSFVWHPSIERIVIVEIEPLITDVSAAFFEDVNYAVLSDPRVEVVHDDARHFMLTTNERFDLITSDPIHPWMKGAAALYTEEYFSLASERLNPGGVITQWVPLYETTADVVKSELATFFRVFPEGTVWSNDIQGVGYDVLLAAKKGDFRVDVTAMADRLRQGEYEMAAISLAEVGFSGAEDLLTTYAGRARDLGGWLDGALINHDRDLRLMYLAGLSLNRYEEATIFQEIASHRSFPEDLFTGSAEELAYLRVMMGG